MEYAWIGYVVMGIAIGFGWGVLAQEGVSEFVRNRAIRGRIVIDAPFSPYQEQILRELIRNTAPMSEKEVERKLERE